jgi:hypothetical protein
MNKINFFTHKLLTGAIALALAALVAQANAETVSQKITVLKVTGSARYMTGGGSWMPLNKGDVLPPGSVIETASKSTVDLAMGEEQGAVYTQPLTTSISMPGGGGGGDSTPKSNTLRVYESSVLSIDKLTTDGTGADQVSETQLDLRAGKILGNVKKLSAASRYEVKIPQGVAGIRGTTYVIDATTGQIWVLQGEVDVVYVTIVNGQTQTVKETITAGMSSSPTAPIPVVQPAPPTGPVITAPGIPTITETIGNGTILIKVSNN